ncbi:unnamed protein product [Penicillium palitans]
MSYYITIHHGHGVDESTLNKWVNITFSKRDLFYLRTDGALICFIIERIREKKCTITLKPKDREARWCISIPASRAHKSSRGVLRDALQLAEWYKVQILNGKECCRENVCDRVLHPEWWAKDTYQDPEDTGEGAGEGAGEGTSKDS